MELWEEAETRKPSESLVSWAILNMSSEPDAESLSGLYRAQPVRQLIGEGTCHQAY